MLGVPVAHERSTPIEFSFGTGLGTEPAAAWPGVYGGCSLRFMPSASVIVSRLQLSVGVACQT